MAEPPLEGPMPNSRVAVELLTEEPWGHYRRSRGTTTTKGAIMQLQDEPKHSYQRSRGATTGGATAKQCVRSRRVTLEGDMAPLANRAPALS